MQKRALEAFCPSPPSARPIPYGLVSLWDMINFNCGLAHLMLQVLASQERYAHDKAILAHGIADLGHPDIWADADTRTQVDNTLTTCANVFAGI